MNKQKQPSKIGADETKNNIIAMLNESAVQGILTIVGKDDIKVVVAGIEYPLLDGDYFMVRMSKRLTNPALVGWVAVGEPAAEPEPAEQEPQPA